MMRIRGKVVGNPTITPMKIPDWNQNDERKADYIKNRTHYEEGGLIGEAVATGDWLVFPLTQPFDWNNAEIFVNGEKVEYEVWDNIEQEDLIQIAVNGSVLLQYYGASAKPLGITITSWTPSGTHIQIYQSSVKTLDEKYIPNSIARTKSDIANIEYIKDGYTYYGFKATFSAPLEVGMQLFYNYYVRGNNNSGMSKPIKLNSDNKLEVIIGNQYQTEKALKGVCDIDSKVMIFTYIEDVNFILSVKEISIPTPIPFKFLGLGNGLNAGYNNVVTEGSVNSNNFGSNNYIDGNFNNIFGTGNRIEAQSSAIFGQDSTILANLCYLLGDKNNSTGRCTFGVGTLIDMLGTNSGAIGYGLIASGDYQFVAGKFNEPDKDAAIIIGDGIDDANRSNSFVVKKDGRILIKEETLLKLTQEDRDKLNSFSSTGNYNTNTGKISVQLGFMNKNANENVMQLGRENTTEGSKAGYTYQLGFSNSSSAGQNYLWGRNLKSAVYEQWVAGKYNAEDKDALYILGNGKSDTNRANAFVVKKTNDVYYEGNIYSKGNKVLTSSDLNAFSGTIASLIAKIEALENERDALVSRVEALENK